MTNNNKRSSNIGHEYEHSYESKLRRTKDYALNDNIPGKFRGYEESGGNTHR